MLCNILYYCQRSTCVKRFLRPSSGAQNLYTQHRVYISLACCSFITVNALHVSGDSSAHHQELKTCTHSIGYMSVLLAAPLLLSTLYMCQAIPPPIIRSSKTVHTASGICQFCLLLLYYCQRSTCVRRFLRPSSGAQKLYTQHRVYVNLACCYAGLSFKGLCNNGKYRQVRWSVHGIAMLVLRTWGL